MKLFDVKEYTNIDGNLTYQIPVGYCTCSLHEGYITKNEAKTHRCFSKSCKYLIKNDGDGFWYAIENKKVLKRYYNFIKKEYYRNEISRNDYVRLKKVKDRVKMRHYIESRKQDVIDKYRTESNYVSKLIIHPKKPNILAQIKNSLKIMYNRWTKARAA